MTDCCVPPSDANSGNTEALYPQGSVPDARMQQTSTLCSTGHTPLIMTGLLREILKQHFADPTNVVSATLRRYLEREGVWSEGANTGIYIESIARWRPEITEVRPALIIKEGDWEFQRMGIGDAAGIEERSGIEHYLAMWQGTHTVFALGGEGAETQVLAIEVAKLLAWLSPQIADQLKLHRFHLTKIGALAASEESTENYVVPVSMLYFAEERWSLAIEAPRLKRFTLSLDAILADLV